jgi:hypothetical protein
MMRRAEVGSSQVTEQRPYPQPDSGRSRFGSLRPGPLFYLLSAGALGAVVVGLIRIGQEEGRTAVAYAMIPALILTWVIMRAAARTTGSDAHGKLLAAVATAITAVGGVIGFVVGR